MRVTGNCSDCPHRESCEMFRAVQQHKVNAAEHIGRNTELTAKLAAYDSFRFQLCTLMASTVRKTSELMYALEEVRNACARGPAEPNQQDPVNIDMDGFCGD
jgi:hypothetical protein